MGKKDKVVKAVVKEDAKVMTTQDEGVIPNEKEKAGNEPDATRGDAEGQALKVETQDEKTNKVGVDIETLARPEDRAPLEKDESLDFRDEDAAFRYLQRLDKQNVQLRGVVIYLVKSLMTPADIEDFKALFPGLM